MPRLNLRLRQFLAVALMVILSVGLASCGKRKIRSLFGGQLPLRVEVDQAVNHSSPIAVDVLVVYQESVLERLMGLTAHDYFGQKEQLARDFPDGFAVLGSWELVPGQRAFDEYLDYKVGADALLIYADYFAPGAHRVRLETRRQATLKLAETGFTVEVVQ